MGMITTPARARYAGHRFPGADHSGRVFVSRAVHALRRLLAAGAVIGSTKPSDSRRLNRQPDLSFASPAGAIGTNNDSADTKTLITKGADNDARRTVGVTEVAIGAAIVKAAEAQRASFADASLSDKQIDEMLADHRWRDAACANCGRLLCV
jgi:hypothetical protein